MSAPLANPVATILSGASQSQGVYLGVGELIGIQMPTGWDAADITILGSADGVTYQQMKDTSATEVDYKAAASLYVLLATPLRCPWIIVRSGTGAVPVNQSANRLLTLVVRKFSSIPF
jgi:Na+-transporting methylmalonyl-CoA/oxaloacetate decarboxylase beta subunit